MCIRDSPHLEYLLSVLYFWRFDRPPKYLINPEVRTAFEATVQFFESIFTHYPRGRASEKEKRRYAREAAEQVQKHILEPYEKLLKKAAENIAMTIERGQQPLGEGENPSEIKFQQLEQEAQQILEKHSKELADRLSEKRTVPELSLIHISEPTRLLSISYAVFCLKKKKKKNKS